MLIDYALGQGSIVLRVKLRSNSSPFNGITGLTSSSTGLNIATIVDNEATTTAYTGANLETITTLGTYAAPTSGKARFKKLDDTNHPGIYEIQIADARFAVSSAKSVIISINGVDGMIECDVLVPLRQVNPYLTPGSAGGQLIAGVNAATTFAGANASGATPATSGLTISGGAASTTGGGVSAPALKLTGGAGAASTNGAAAALVAAAGGTVTVSGAAGFSITGGGAFPGIDLIAGATGDGLRATGGSTSGHGVYAKANAVGAGNGIKVSGFGSGGHGLYVISASGLGASGIYVDGDANGLYLAGETASGIYAQGLNGPGIWAVGADAAGGINAQPGIYAVGGAASASIASAAGPGISAIGGAASTASGNAAAAGISAIGGAGAASTNGAAAGVVATAGGTTTVSGASGVAFTGTGNKHGMELTGAGTGKGIDPTTQNQLADSYLVRDMSNVEGSAPEHSLCFVVLAATECDLATTPGSMIVYKTDGTTTFATKTLTTDATANPITKIQ